MKIRLPLMIQDPSARVFSEFGLEKWYEGFHPDKEEFYLDGPVSKRLAVVDFSPRDGRVQVAARFRPPGDDYKLGFFVNTRGQKLHQPSYRQIFTPAFLEVVSFAMVLRVMYMFERKETLGRELEWAFDAPQLLIVPRAGEKANAYYHRDSHSLQFFYVSDTDSGRPMYTCLSRDIVAHETGHAIIDSIDPYLLDACTPQSLAIHEGLADLTASLMAFESHNLRETVLTAREGSIENSTVFSSIAEEFGSLFGERYGLRNLNNEKNLDPDDQENCVSRTEPHELGMVLSGALYKVLMVIYDDLKKRYVSEKRKTLMGDISYQYEEDYQDLAELEVSLSGYSLAKATERFQRMIFRALDYLPPGEVSFADLGRAMIAVDRIAYEKDPKMRDWICEEFLKRRIIEKREALDIETSFPEPLEVDIEKLHSSDWTAYWFANNNRPLLFIPDEIEFKVLPRLYLEKKTDEGTGRELLFKVSWDAEETHDVGSRYPTARTIPVGTTLAINWETKEILARLTNASPVQQDITSRDLKDTEVRENEYVNQKSDRDVFIKRLVEQDILKRNKSALDHEGKPLLSAIQAEVSYGRMRIRGTGKLFHIIDRREEP